MWLGPGASETAQWRRGALGAIYGATRQRWDPDTPDQRVALQIQAARALGVAVASANTRTHENEGHQSPGPLALGAPIPRRLRRAGEHGGGKPPNATFRRG